MKPGSLLDRATVPMLDFYGPEDCQRSARAKYRRPGTLRYALEGVRGVVHAGVT